MIFGIKSYDQAVTDAWRKTLIERISADMHDAEKLESLTISNMSIFWSNSTDKYKMLNLFRKSPYTFMVYGNIKRLSNTDAASCTDFLFKTYLNLGIKGLSGLNGRYVIIVLDKEKNTLNIANDILGLIPFYYYSDGKSFLFGSRYYQLNYLPTFKRDLNLHAFSDFLQLGYVIGDRTLYKGVSRIPSGSTLICNDKNGVSVKNISRLSFTEERWGLPADNLAEEMEHKLLDSMRGWLTPQDNAVVPLSGGLDSRVVAILASKLNLPLSSFSFGSVDNLETIIAARVARTLGIDHQSIAIPLDYLNTYLHKHIDLLEGCVSPTVSWWFAMLEAYVGSTITILSGKLGDATSGGHLDLLPAENDISTSDIFDFAFNKMIKKEGGFTTQELQDILEPDIYNQLNNVTYETNRDLFFSNGDHDFQRIMNYDLLTRQRCFIAPDMVVQELAGGVVCPFIDTNYLQFVTTLPLNALRGQCVYREMIRRSSPKIAKITYANENKPLIPSYKESIWLKRGTAPEPVFGWKLSRIIRALGLVRTEKDWWAEAYTSSPGFNDLINENLRILEGIFNKEFIEKISSDLPQGANMKRERMKIASAKRKIAQFIAWNIRYMNS